MSEFSDFLKRLRGYDEFATYIRSYPDVAKALEDGDVSAFLAVCEKRPDVLREFGKLTGIGTDDFHSGGPTCSGSSLGSPP